MADWKFFMQLTGQLGNHFIRYCHWGSIWTADVHVWLNPWWIQQLRQWIWMLSQGSGMKLGTTGRGWVLLLFFFFFLFFFFVFSFCSYSCFLSWRFFYAVLQDFQPQYVQHIYIINCSGYGDTICLHCFHHGLRKTTRPTYRRHLSQALVSLHGGKMHQSWNPHLHLLHCVVSSQWRSLESTAQWTWIISVPSLLPCIKPVAHKFRPTGWVLIVSTHQQVE